MFQLTGLISLSLGREREDEGEAGGEVEREGSQDHQAGGGYQGHER